MSSSATVARVHIIPTRTETAGPCSRSRLACSARGALITLGRSLLEVRRFAPVKAVAAIVAWVLATGTGFAGVAGAGEVRCGDVITVDTRLHGDVGPCSNGGLVVGGDGIRLDLNGHSVFGMADMGDGVGISVIGRSGVVVTNGTVWHFDAGVYIEGGGYNRLSHLSVQDNSSSATAPRS